MARLFVAIELPVPVIAELVRVQPRLAAGLRIVKPQQMHLTLHFLGEADIDQTVDALAQVKATPFTLLIDGLGRFPPQGRANVLWAGVSACRELLELHATVGTALASIGFNPESRPYAPHITLARCGGKLDANIVDEFLEQADDFTLPAVSVEGFALFSSTILEDGPVYRRERWFSF